MKNKKKFILLGALLFLPQLSHAAFTFNQIANTGDNIGFKAYSLYVHRQTVDILSPTFSDIWVVGGGRLPAVQACQNVANRSGVSSQSDTYCSYQYSDTQFCIGGVDWYPGGGNSGESCSGGFPYLEVRIYQSSLVQTTVSTLVADLGAYLGAYFNWQFGTAPSYIPMQGPPPADPGYRDICEHTNGTEIAFTSTYGEIPPSFCRILKHVGVTQPLPVANLSASPSTVVSGSASALTYSCSNSATSATLDNGLGAQANPSAGTLSVSPTNTTTYTLTCTNSVGSSQSQATVTVIPVLSGTCSVSPSSITAGGSATWSASASGGTGVYSYSWSGTDGVSGTTQTITPTYSSAGSKSASVAITSGTQSVNISCSNTLTVNPAPLPNLTSGAITPTSATAGQATTLSTTNTNLGSTGAGAFPTLFQVQETGALVASSYNAGLGAGATAPASISYTFTSAGTYNVRACANYNTSWTAIVSESNYGDNCGPWTPITVAGSASPSTACTASPTSLPQSGGTVTYSANSSGGASAPYTWTPSDGVGSYGTNNTTTRTFTSADAGSQYGMSVQASQGAGTLSNCPAVPVGGVCTGTPTGTISASPSRVRSGTPTQLSVSTVQNVKVSCTITGPGVNQTIPAASCAAPATTTATPAITTQSVYKLTCDGTPTSQVVVNVVPNFQEF